MHILFEAIRDYCKHGSLITYDQRLHARRGASTLSGGTNAKVCHSHLAAIYSCQQHLPDDSYKEPFLAY